MDPAAPIQDFDQRFQLKVSARAGPLSFSESLPILLVSPCCRETVFIENRDSHARLRKASGAFITPIGLFDVFSQRELDPSRCLAEQQSIRIRTPTKLDDRILSSYRIGGTMQKIGDSQSSSELVVDVIGFGINHVCHPHHGSGRHGAFIDATHDHAVGMGIDEPGCQMLAVGVNDQTASKISLR